MNDCINLLDVVALAEDLPPHHLSRGQVGTVVECLEPDVYEVEFSDNDGHAYETVALRSDQIIVLHYEPASQAN